MNPGPLHYELDAITTTQSEAQSEAQPETKSEAQPETQSETHSVAIMDHQGRISALVEEHIGYEHQVLTDMIRDYHH